MYVCSDAEFNGDVIRWLLIQPCCTGVKDSILAFPLPILFFSHENKTTMWTPMTEIVIDIVFDHSNSYVSSRAMLNGRVASKAGSFERVVGDVDCAYA